MVGLPLVSYFSDRKAGTNICRLCTGERKKVGIFSSTRQTVENPVDSWTWSYVQTNVCSSIQPFYFGLREHQPRKRKTHSIYFISLRMSNMQQSGKDIKYAKKMWVQLHSCAMQYLLCMGWDDDMKYCTVLGKMHCQKSGVIKVVLVCWQ